MNDNCIITFLLQQKSNILSLETTPSTMKHAIDLSRGTRATMQSPTLEMTWASN